MKDEIHYILHYFIIIYEKIVVRERGLRVDEFLRDKSINYKFKRYPGSSSQEL